jgi:uncharacterized integral membrane protein
MWALRTFFIIVLIVLVVGFSIYNSDERVSVNLYGKEYIEVPMIFVAFWALVIGMVLSFVLGVSYYFKMHSELRSLRKENKRLLDEVTTLRNLPLEETEEKEELGA